MGVSTHNYYKTIFLKQIIGTGENPFYFVDLRGEGDSMTFKGHKTPLEGYQSLLRNFNIHQDVTDLESIYWGKYQNAFPEYIFGRCSHQL